MHWFQYAPFVVTAFATNFSWAFFNDASFHHFAEKFSGSSIVMDITL